VYKRREQKTDKRAKALSTAAIRLPELSLSLVHLQLSGLQLVATATSVHLDELLASILETAALPLSFIARQNGNFLCPEESTPIN